MVLDTSAGPIALHLVEQLDAVLVVVPFPYRARVPQPYSARPRHDFLYVVRPDSFVLPTPPAVRDKTNVDLCCSSRPPVVNYFASP